MVSAARSAWIVGVGETPCVRRADVPYPTLQVRAVQDALDDAGLAPGAVDAVVADGNLMPTICPTDLLLAAARLDAVETTLEVTRAPGYAVQVARDLVETGRARTVLVCFGVNWGSAAAGPFGFHERYAMKGVFEEPQGFFGQPLYYALWARSYAEAYGFSDEELGEGLGWVAVNQRFNAAGHPGAQDRRPMTLADHAASAPIAEPLRTFDCSLVTDGAGAVVVAEEAVARGARSRPVRIAGAGSSPEARAPEDFFTQSPTMPVLPSVAPAAQDALGAAGVTPGEVDVWQIYDCFTISLVLQLEELGLCERGGGLDHVRDGRTRYDGPHPINTHGGLLSHGHVIGMGHVIEGVRQVRGDAGARQVPGVEVAAVTMPPTRYSTTLVLTP